MRKTSLKTRVAAVAVLAGTALAGSSMLAPAAQAAPLGSWTFQHFFGYNGAPTRDPWQVAWDGCQVRFPGTHSVRPVTRYWQGILRHEGKSYDTWMLTYQCLSDK